MVHICELMQIVVEECGCQWRGFWDGERNMHMLNLRSWFFFSQFSTQTTLRDSCPVLLFVIADTTILRKMRKCSKSSMRLPTFSSPTSWNSRPRWQRMAKRPTGLLKTLSSLPTCSNSMTAFVSGRRKPHTSPACRLGKEACAVYFENLTSLSGISGFNTQTRTQGPSATSPAKPAREETRHQQPSPWRLAKQFNVKLRARTEH